jgi:hypothetical protein
LPLLVDFDDAEVVGEPGANRVHRRKAVRAWLEEKAE